AIALARRYLGFFPSSCDEPAPRRSGPDAGPRRLERILEIMPANNRRPYKVLPILEELVDGGDLLEIQPRYGRRLRCPLAWLRGRSGAILANNPAVRAGAVDSPAAIKAMDFVATADTFGLPLVFLADNPGVMAGTQAERDGILKWGGKMFKAQRRARVPELHRTIRNTFRVGAGAMGQTPVDQK